MSTCRDLENMIQALTLTIAVHEQEEAYFRRSFEISTCRESKLLLLEIADEMRSHISSLEEKKSRLVSQLAGIKQAGRSEGDR
jgi:hypothetical protein